MTFIYNCKSPEGTVEKYSTWLANIKSDTFNSKNQDWNAYKVVIDNDDITTHNGSRPTVLHAW